MSCENSGLIVRGCCFGCTDCMPEIFEKLRELIPEGLVLKTIPPIPEEARTCNFCSEPCGNEHCCMKDEK